MLQFFFIIQGVIPLIGRWQKNRYPRLYLAAILDILNRERLAMLSIAALHACKAFDNVQFLYCRFHNLLLEPNDCYSFLFSQMLPWNQTLRQTYLTICAHCIHFVESQTWRSKEIGGIIVSALCLIKWKDRSEFNCSSTIFLTQYKVVPSVFNSFELSQWLCSTENAALYTFFELSPY
jgi:hypothetical protein